MRTTLPRLLAVAAALVAAAPVVAQSETPSMTVSSSGFDLSDPKGRAAFERRIGRATKRVCALPNNRELAVRMRERQCVKASQARSGKDVAALFSRHDRVKAAQAGPGDVVATR